MKAELTPPKFPRKLRAWPRNPGLNQPPRRRDAELKTVNQIAENGKSKDLIKRVGKFVKLLADAVKPI